MPEEEAVKKETFFGETFINASVLPANGAATWHDASRAWVQGALKHGGEHFVPDVVKGYFIGNVCIILYKELTLPGEKMGGYSAFFNFSCSFCSKYSMKSMCLCLVSV